MVTEIKPIEHFKELVSNAIQRQKVITNEMAEYYMAMGSSCYSYVASVDRNGEIRRLFSELAAKFPAFVDVLNEVSERSRLTSSKDILRIYERWLRTKSKFAEKALGDMGIEPTDTGTK